MKFVVSSTDLLSHLQAISRVISNKSTLPILDNFLFDLKDNKLVLTASDLEVTMVTSLELENVDGEGNCDSTNQWTNNRVDGEREEPECGQIL